jgi:hypothetical protein
VYSSSLQVTKSENRANKRHSCEMECVWTDNHELTPLYVTPHVAKRGCMAGELGDLTSSQVAIRSLNSLNSISVVMSGVAAKTTTATPTTTALQELISMPTAPYIAVLGVSPRTPTK